MCNKIHFHPRKGSTEKSMHPKDFIDVYIAPQPKPPVNPSADFPSCEPPYPGFKRDVVMSAILPSSAYWAQRGRG